MGIRDSIRSLKWDLGALEKEHDSIVDDLKAEYENRISELEERIWMLENENEELRERADGPDS